VTRALRAVPEISAANVEWSSSATAQK
jgi:hypothetical protein